MPYVEVLPNSTATVAPGWTYIVDTGYDPSKVAINPKNKRRAAAQPGVRNESELSSRQQAAVARRIAELDRDNDAKQTIAIPGKPIASKTQNARRILQYQRQIKHWLDDEEAQIAQAAQAPPPRNAAGLPLRRQSTAFEGAGNSLAASSGHSLSLGLSLSHSLAIDPTFSDDTLLSVDGSVPLLPQQAEIEALLATPPLSYAASRVAPPSANGPPLRHFCDNCGYWGTIKCRKCGARVCGLECRDTHEATRCLKWA